MIDLLKELDDSYTIQLSEEMIAIPSVTGDEEALALYIKDKLESYGMEIELNYVCARASLWAWNHYTSTPTASPTPTSSRANRGSRASI